MDLPVYQSLGLSGDSRKIHGNSELTKNHSSTMATSNLSLSNNHLFTHRGTVNIYKPYHWPLNKTPWTYDNLLAIIQHLDIYRALYTRFLVNKTYWEQHINWRMRTKSTTKYISKLFRFLITSKMGRTFRQR